MYLEKKSKINNFRKFKAELALNNRSTTGNHFDIIYQYFSKTMKCETYFYIDLQYLRVI